MRMSNHTDDTTEALQALAALLRASREQTEALIAHGAASSRLLTEAMGEAFDATSDTVQAALAAR